jgi:hypothetical protein
MNRGFFIKLTIAIVAGFGLLLAGFHVYWPVWFKIQEYRLMSDDPATMASAASAIAEKGKFAIPRIQKWLESPSDRLVIGACKALENMSGDLWQETIPELFSILKRRPDECSDAAAALLISKGLNGDDFCDHLYHRYSFGYEPATLDFSLESDGGAVTIHVNAAESCGMLAYLIKSGEYEHTRAGAAYTLGLINPRRAKKRLMEAIGAERNPPVRACAAYAIGEIRDPGLFDFMYEALQKENDDGAYAYMIEALSKLDAERAYPVCLDCFANCKRSFGYIDICSAGIKSPDARLNALFGLARSGKKECVPALLESLKNDRDRWTRWYLPFVISCLAGGESIQPLGEVLKTENDTEIHISVIWSFAMLDNDFVVPVLISEMQNISLTKRWQYIADPGVYSDFYVKVNPMIAAAFALSRFQGDAVENALHEARDRGNPGAAVALAIRNGGEDLEFLKSYKSDNSDNVDFTIFLGHYAKAKWGDKDAMDYYFQRMGLPLFIDPQYCGVFDTMPEDFPKFDFKWSMDEKTKWNKTVKQWGAKNISRLAWDAEKRKYYLKTADKGNK